MAEGRVGKQGGIGKEKIKSRSLKNENVRATRSNLRGLFTFPIFFRVSAGIVRPRSDKKLNWKHEFALVIKWKFFCLFVALQKYYFETKYHMQQIKKNCSVKA